MRYTVRDEYLSLFGCKVNTRDLLDQNAVECLEEDFGIDLCQIKDMLDELEG